MLANLRTRGLAAMRASAFLPRGNRRLFALLVALLPCWLSVAAAQDQQDGDLLTELKVAYIYNFTHFIEWPTAPAERPFVIGVIGDPVMERSLRVLEQEAKRVDDRPIEIRAYSTPEAIGPSEILFVGAEAQEALAAILRHTAGRPTLLVGDTPGDAERGLAIEIYRKPDIFRKTERLRLRINASALKDRGLAASARLYDVAEVVR